MVPWSRQLWSIVLEGRPADEEPLGFSRARQAVDALLRHLDPDRIVPVLARVRPLPWEREFLDIPVERIVVEPLDRGSAARLLLALTHVQRQDPEAIVLVVDAARASELVHEHFGHALSQAAVTTQWLGERLILIGETPESANPCERFILSAKPDSSGPESVTRYVRARTPCEAASLVLRGALRDTHLVAGGVNALLALYARRHPDLVVRFIEHLAPRFLCRPWAHEYLFLGLPELDFHDDVLTDALDLVHVVTLPELGPSDETIAHTDFEADWRTRGLRTQEPLEFAAA